MLTWEAQTGEFIMSQPGPISSSPPHYGRVIYPKTFGGEDEKVDERYR